MGLSQVLATSLSGLDATQTGLSIVAGNIANVQTPGYVDKTTVQVETTAGSGGQEVRITAINRELNSFVQQQLVAETSGGASADLQASFYNQLQQIYGQPGSTNALDSLFNNFTSAIQALATNPNSSSAESGVIGAGQSLTQQLNSMSGGVQALRSQADQGIAADVQQVNAATQQIAQINQQLAKYSSNDSTTAALEDQRDQAISTLAKLMDIRVTYGNNNQVAVFTGSGAQLVGAQASQLSFSAQGTLTANQQWNADPAKSGLSSITLVSPNGGTTDLLASRGLRSGELAAYVQMRDTVLVQAQRQIDEFAAQMSRALSDVNTEGSTVSVGTQAGFKVDIGSLSPGNTINIAYTDGTSKQHNITIVRVDDPTALPLSNTITSNPNDKVIGVNFSGGTTSIVAQLNSALGFTGMQFSNPSGTTLQVLDGGPGTVAVNDVSTTTTMTSLAGGTSALPLFVDSTAPFTGAITSAGNQITGYAGRISLNSALVDDPAALVAYQAGTPAGDSTRPTFIYNQLTNASLVYSPTTGIGGTATPFQGTLLSYLSQVISQQAQAATSATNLQQGQDVVVNALQQRFNQSSGVNIDTEMSRLLTLQTAYSANARVMTAVKQMMDALLQM